MKTLQNLLLIFLAAMLCSLSNCNKDNKDDDSGKPPTQQEEQLPPVTTTGAETFGCKVNGKVWVAKTNKTGWTAVYISVNKHVDINWYVNITGNIVLNNKENVVIGMTYYNTFNDYYLLHINKNGYSAGYTDFLTNQLWKTDSVIGGGVNILRFDTIQQIISGTFSFKCVNHNTQDTLDITEGRFDMHYTY